MSSVTGYRSNFTVSVDPAPAAMDLWGNWFRFSSTRLACIPANINCTSVSTVTCCRGNLTSSVDRLELSLCICKDLWSLEVCGDCADAFFWFGVDQLELCVTEMNYSGSPTKRASCSRGFEDGE